MNNLTRAMGLYLLDSFGEPYPVTSTMAWGEGMKNKTRRVASTMIRDTWISTVFLGLDHSFGVGQPVLFETMVFSKNEEPGRHMGAGRCCTWEQAIAMHRSTVDDVKATIRIKKRRAPVITEITVSRKVLAKIV